MSNLITEFGEPLGEKKRSVKNFHGIRTGLLAVGFEAASEPRSVNSESGRIRSNLSIQICNRSGRWQTFLGSINVKACDLLCQSS